MDHSSPLKQVLYNGIQLNYVVNTEGDVFKFSKQGKIGAQITPLHYGGIQSNSLYYKLTHEGERVRISKNKLLEDTFAKYPIIKEIETYQYDKNLIYDGAKLSKIYHQISRKTNTIVDEELSVLIKALPLLIRGYYVVEKCSCEDRKRAERLQSVSERNITEESVKRYRLLKQKHDEELKIHNCRVRIMLFCELIQYWADEMSMPPNTPLSKCCGQQYGQLINILNAHDTNPHTINDTTFINNARLLPAILLAHYIRTQCDHLNVIRLERLQQEDEQKETKMILQRYDELYLKYVEMCRAGRGVERYVMLEDILWFYNDQGSVLV